MRAAIFLKLSLLDCVDWLENRYLIQSGLIIIPKLMATVGEFSDGYVAQD